MDVIRIGVNGQGTAIHIVAFTFILPIVILLREPYETNISSTFYPGIPPPPPFVRITFESRFIGDKCLFTSSLFFLAFFRVLPFSQISFVFFLDFVALNYFIIRYHCFFCNSIDFEYICNEILSVLEIF